MKVLRLEGDGLAIDLHPQVTVVRGMDGPTRERLVEALAGLAAGRVEGISGLVEVDGEQLFLQPDGLARLELRPDLDPVVRADQLPGFRPRRSSAETRLRDLEAERATLVRRLEVAQALRRRTIEEQESLREQTHGSDGTDEAAPSAAERQVEREAVLTAARERVERARAARVEADRTLAEAQAASAALRPVSRPGPGEIDDARARHASATAALEAATSALAEAHADLAALDRPPTPPTSGESGPDPDDGRGGGGDDHEALTARRSEIEAALLPLAGTDPAPVLDALARFEADGSEADARPVPEPFVEPAPAPVRGDDGDDPRAAAVVSARIRVDQARMALREAGGGRAGPLSVEDVDAVEAAHARVMAAQDRADGRRRSGRAGRRLESAVADERDVLDRLGFDTFAAYVMAAGAPAMAKTDDPVDAARAELAAAEAALAEAEAGLADADTDTDAGPAPRRSASDQGSELRDALAAVGLEVGDVDLSVDALLGLARSWLVEHEAAAARAAELSEELADTDRRLTALQPAPSVETVAAEAEEEAAEDGEAIRSRIAALEEEVSRRQVEAEQLAGHAAALEAAEQAAEAAAPTATEALSEVERATVARVLAAADESEAMVALQEVEAAEVAPPEARTAEAAVRELRADHEVRLAAAAEVRASAEGEVQLLNIEIRAAERRLADVRAEVESERAADDTGEPIPVDDIEWYLLARLATHRRSGPTTSVPLVLDDPFGHLGPGVAAGLVSQLARMATAVQVVVISDDPALSDWAGSAGPDRAAVVSS